MYRDREELHVYEIYKSLGTTNSDQTHSLVPLVAYILIAYITSNFVFLLMTFAMLFYR